MTEVDSYHDDGVFLMSLTAYGSTNLVASSQVVREPTQIDEVVGSKFDGSYSEVVGILNPRDNNVVDDCINCTCRAYDTVSAIDEIVFELPEPMYIEYIHANS